MAERLQPQSEGTWYWGEADPKTAAVIGALATPPKGISMEKNTAVAASSHAGFRISLDAMNDAWSRQFKEFADMRGLDHDPEAVPKAVIDALDGLERDHMRAVLQELGQLAGGSREIADMELLIGDQIEAQEGYEAIPGLKVLSQLAMDRMIVVGGNMPRRPAPSPEGYDHDFSVRPDRIGA